MRMKSLGPIIAAGILLAGCGGSEEPAAPPSTPAVTAEPTHEPTPAATDVPEPTATATPVAEPEPTSEPTSTPPATPSPTPSPTPNMITRTCQANRDNAGLDYEFERGTLTEAQAREEYCGTLAPISAVCPEYRVNRGLEHEYDPDDFNEEQAEEENCGVISAWRVIESTDQLDGAREVYAVTFAIDHDFDDMYFEETPRLAVQCRDAELRVYFVAETENDIKPSSYGSGIRVAYRFNDGPVIDDTWGVVDGYKQTVTKEGIGRLDFVVNKLQDGGEFVIRVWNENDNPMGTATFNIDGAEEDVGMALDECGY